MRRVFPILLICALMSCSGCVTRQTLQTIHGQQHTDGETGKVIVDEAPRRANYVLLPFAFVIDVATSPFQAPVWWSMAHYSEQ
jgi:uncharacterized protein YceK